MGRSQQLSLNVGGATVDQGLLGSIKWAKEVNEIEQDFKKGDDIIVSVRCRVLGAKPLDHYDAHGNISKTTKTFILRADDLIDCHTDTPEAYKVPVETEDDAVAEAEAARRAQDQTTSSNDGATPQPDAEPEGSGEPADDRHLASV